MYKFNGSLTNLNYFLINHWKHIILQKIDNMVKYVVSEYKF